MPGRITIKTKDEQRTYVATVFKVLTKNVRGVPMTLHLVENEEMIELKGGEEFMIAYVSENWFDSDEFNVATDDDAH